VLVKPQRFSPSKLFNFLFLTLKRILIFEERMSADSFTVDEFIERGKIEFKADGTCKRNTGKPAKEKRFTQLKKSKERIGLIGDFNFLKYSFFTFVKLKHSTNKY
jgi:hypothetical protein